MKRGLLKATMNADVTVEKGINYYHLCGFLIVLQIFAYEIFLDLGHRYLKRLDEDMFPRMLCWIAESEMKIFNEDLKNHIFVNANMSIF